MTNKWPKQSECDAFYGNPRGRNGLASAEWESAALTKVYVPWRLYTAWNGADGLPSPVKTIRVHKGCAHSLAAVLNAIWDAAGSQATIEHWGMDKYGGGYNFRAIRGGSRLSMHSYGCAVDFDPARNGMGDKTPHFASCPQVLAAFKAEGWEWGGDWPSPDGMHWQAART